MASVFSMIISGELPGRFVWQDDDVVSFLTINPLTEGHVLVVPRQEVDHWESVDDELWAKLNGVARIVGRAVRTAYDAPRTGLVIAGLEVPHLHLHVFPAHTMGDFDFATAEKEPSSESLDRAQQKIRDELRALGYADNVPE
ncbi:HIT family protein [Rhodococcus sp. (in: high G+C Gram-positive bacteria)]|uniref:HIT family protein n=1 Tax=Rhodococcus sp. TaxID=1831 RepID=UPI001A0CAE06|nr:HIT family protein [Rhodococcus sp. (in: high G+C Gram-positive bacteria)]MBF0663486.1 HIT family protein [Rhodococcus sp. (in: high G+C Gram-positive bacteria)]